MSSSGTRGAFLSERIEQLPHVGWVARIDQWALTHDLRRECDACAHEAVEVLRARGKGASSGREVSGASALASTVAQSDDFPALREVY